MVSSIADRLNVSKADILDPEADNAAVRLALAETHVISETKTYLESVSISFILMGLSLTATAGRRRSGELQSQVITE